MPSPTLIDLVSDVECSDTAIETDLSTVKDGFMEVFSPRRIGPACLKLGVIYHLAMDLLTGWDFCKVEVRARAIAEVNQRMPYFIGLSPPCTMFSPLQTLFNLKKMKLRKPLEWKRRMKEAMRSLEFFIVAGQDAGGPQRLLLP